MLGYAEVLALAVWNWVTDGLCLAFAIGATGARIPHHGVFLAYCGAMALGSVGLTPGGLGVIEATLAAGLVAAGVDAHHALAAVLVYRIISFWIVIGLGWLILALLTRQSGSAPANDPVNL